MKNFTITSTKAVDFTVEVPRYFKISHLHYMIINDDDVMIVNPFYLSDLLSYAYIKVDKSNWHSDFWAKNEIEPLSEQEFRQVLTDAFLAMSKLIEK